MNNWKYTYFQPKGQYGIGLKALFFIYKIAASFYIIFAKIAHAHFSDQRTLTGAFNGLTPLKAKAAISRKNLPVKGRREALTVNSDEF